MSPPASLDYADRSSFVLETHGNASTRALLNTKPTTDHDYAVGGAAGGGAVGGAVAGGAAGVGLAVRDVDLSRGIDGVLRALRRQVALYYYNTGLYHHNFVLPCYAVLAR